MNFKRIGMVLVSLVLVACLIVNVSPIKAEAAIDWLLILELIPDEVLWGIIVGAGIGLVCDSLEDFVSDVETVAEGCKLWLKENTDLLTAEGAIRVLSTNDPDLPYMVEGDLIEAVRQYLVESEIVTETFHEITDGMCSYSGVELPALSDSFYEKYPYVAIAKGQTAYGYEGYYLYASPAPFYYRVNTMNTYWLDDFTNISGSAITSFSGEVSGDAWVGWSAVTWSVPHGGSLPGPHTYGVLWSNFDMYKCEYVDSTLTALDTLHIAGSLPIYPGATTITVADGYESGHIAPLSQLLAEGYEPWHQKSYVYTEDAGNTTTYYPAVVSGNYEDFANLTQEDVWAGTPIGIVAGGDTESGTDTETGSGTDSEADSELGLLADISAVLSAISDYQQTGNIAIQTKIEGLSDTLGITNGLLTDSKGILESILAANVFGFESVVDSVVSLPGSIGDELTDIENQIGTLGGLIGGIDIDTDTMKGTLAGILAGVTSIPAEIADAITGVLTAAFVPTEGYIESKVDDLTSQYAFADSIGKTGIDLKEFFLTLG